MSDMAVTPFIEAYGVLNNEQRFIWSEGRARASSQVWLFEKHSAFEQDLVSSLKAGLSSEG